SRGPESHGSMNVRQPGAIGATDAARVFKGVRMSGQMGNVRTTARAYRVVRVDAERNLLLVKGGVPGAKGALVLVRQSTKKVKPNRQKGTGRARHGSIREPSMKGGGKVFGPKPRDFSQRMPKQMRRLALRSALSQKAIDGQVRVIESFVFDEPKTSQASELLDAIGFDNTTLVVLPAPHYTVSRSFENLAHAKLVLARNLNVRDLLSHTYLLLSTD